MCERSISWLPPALAGTSIICTWTWDGTANLIMCPDLKSNLQLFGYSMKLQPTEPHWPGPHRKHFDVCIASLIFLNLSHGVASSCPAVHSTIIFLSTSCAGLPLVCGLCTSFFFPSRHTVSCWSNRVYVGDFCFLLITTGSGFLSLFSKPEVALFPSFQLVYIFLFQLSLHFS